MYLYFLFLFILPVACQEEWQGYFLGRMSDPRSAGIRGDLYMLSNTKIQVKGFKYGANAPDLYFWLDKGNGLGPTGLKIPTPRNGVQPLGIYRNERVVMDLPPGHRLTDYNTFGLWCFDFAVKYSELTLPWASRRGRS